MDCVDQPRGRTRQRYSNEFKAEIVAQARQPHVSIASVALAHGLNANLLRTWIHHAEPNYTKRKSRLPSVNRPATTSDASEFLPVSFTDNQTSKSDERSIEIEVHKANSTIKVKWPVQASTSCLVWLRELTK